jgi:AcrR family transcriptional regulator
MTRRIERTRGYHSPRRRAQAQATRRLIVNAARHLFLERGYSRTSVSAIAALAGVAAETVYADFGTKRAILAGVSETDVVGPDTPVALVDWPELTSVRAEPEPLRKIQLLTKLYRAIYERSAAMLDVLRAAADGEEEIAELLRLNQQRRLTGQANMMAHFADTGVLRSGLTVDEATDCCWTIASPEVYRLLVHERGWDPDRYESWVSSTLSRLLVDECIVTSGMNREDGRRGAGLLSSALDDGHDEVMAFLGRALTTWTRPATGS